MMTIAEDSPAVEILPFLIDWGQSRHPAWFSWGFCGSLNPEIAGYPLS